MKIVKEDSPNRTDLDQVVKCTRCRNKHSIGDRLYKRSDPVYLIYDEICPKCSCKSYQEVKTEQTKRDRIKTVNEIIRDINSRGRGFLGHNGKADFIFIKDRKLFYHSAYNEAKGFKADICLSVADNVRPLRLLTGGTMQALVRDFCEYIKGNDDANGENGYGGLYCPHWGYDAADMKAIRVKAVELGYLKAKEVSNV